MFKNHYTARVGFITTLDVVCPTHQGRYSSSERTTCPKCNTVLVPFTVTTQKGTHAQCITEVVLYPLLRPADEKQWEERTAKAGALKYQIRVSIWGRYDVERGVAYPDKRVQYMQAGRIVRVELNTKPILRPYTSQKENGAQMIEMKYEFNSNRGDQIEFLDPKQESDEMMANANAVQPPHQATTTGVQPSVTADPIAAMQQEISALTARLDAAAKTSAGSQDEELMKAAAQSPPDSMDPTEDGLGSVNEGITEEYDPFPVA